MWCYYTKYLGKKKKKSSVSGYPIDLNDVIESYVMNYSNEDMNKGTETNETTSSAQEKTACMRPVKQPKQIIPHQQNLKCITCRQ